jgi:hypothetical protein
MLITVSLCPGISDQLTNLPIDMIQDDLDVVMSCDKFHRGVGKVRERLNEDIKITAPCFAFSR